MGVIAHGDIKPQNILIFESEEHKLIAKITDFGNSIAGANEDDLCHLPYSDPWTAPEHHHRKFTVSAAKKMDIYSFSSLCIWLLLDEKQGVVDADSSMKVFREMKEGNFEDKMKKTIQILKLENQMAERFVLAIETSLSQKPEKRVFSMQDLAESFNSDPYGCSLSQHLIRVLTLSGLIQSQFIAAVVYLRIYSM